jgi:hypothetical protein
MSPLDFIDYLLRLIKETENDASNYMVELLKSNIEEYLNDLDEAENKAQGYVTEDS